jgi:hypothetical protein
VVSRHQRATFGVNWYIRSRVTSGHPYTHIHNVSRSLSFLYTESCVDDETTGVETGCQRRIVWRKLGLVRLGQAALSSVSSVPFSSVYFSLVRSRSV